MQKLQLWTAGSISKKARGLSVKNGTYLEILLNGTGLRVESRKTKGLFSKSSGRTGMHDSWPLDLDLVVQICSHRVLIGGVYFRSDGRGPSGVGAAALSRRS